MSACNKKIVSPLIISKVIKLYSIGKSGLEIGRQFGFGKNVVYRILRENNIDRRTNSIALRGKHNSIRTELKSKEKNINWKGGKRMFYHTNARKIMNVTDGKLIVHHIDGDYKNNNLSNLQVVTKSEHAKIHGWELNFNGGKNGIVK